MTVTFPIRTVSPDYLEEGSDRTGDDDDDDDESYLFWSVRAIESLRSARPGTSTDSDDMTRFDH